MGGSWLQLVVISAASRLELESKPLFSYVGVALLRYKTLHSGKTSFTVRAVRHSHRLP